MNVKINPPKPSRWSSCQSVGLHSGIAASITPTATAAIPTLVTAGQGVSAVRLSVFH